MTRIPATLQLDVRLQARSRLYSIGVAIAVVLGLVARSLFDAAPSGRVLAALYLLGVGSTTYVFGASLVLMERTEATLQALRVTGMPTRLYLGSKVLTLSGFAIVEAVIVYAVGFWGSVVDPLPLLAGVAGLGMIYTLVGMGQVAGHDSVTSFLMPGALLVGSVLQLPIFYVLGVGPGWIWYLVPTQGPLLLMLAGFEPLAPWQWGYAVAMTASAVVMSSWWARRRFDRFVRLSDS